MTESELPALSRATNEVSSCLQTADPTHQWAVVLQEKDATGRVTTTLLWYTDDQSGFEGAEELVIDAVRARRPPQIEPSTTSVKVFFLRALAQAEVTVRGVVNPVDLSEVPADPDLLADLPVPAPRPVPEALPDFPDLDELFEPGTPQGLELELSDGVPKMPDDV